MSATRLQTLLPQLHSQRPVTVVGAAVIDVIADAYALPWRGCDIELKQQGVNVGGCALNIAVALKRVGRHYSQPYGERRIAQPDRQCRGR